MDLTTLALTSIFPNTVPNPDMFNGERLKQAREIAGLTQQDLVDAVQQRIDRSYVSHIEQNAKPPSDAVVETVALATGFSKSFFYQRSGPDFPLGSILFRKRTTLSSSDAARVRQTARLILELYTNLQHRFKPIPVTVPRLADIEVSTASQLVRSALGYPPDGPVRGLLTRIERAGVLVFRLPFSLEGFDAFSAWSQERETRPVIVLGTGQVGERDRATLGHELGHLALHSSFLGDLSTVEAQGVEFAGEFLLPTAEMQEEFAGKPPLTLVRLANLKSKWGVSMQFILQRLEQLEIISPQLKSYWRGKIYKQGWIEQEPVPIPTENPAVLRQMLEKAYGAPVDSRSVAREIGLPPRIVAELLTANGREPWRPQNPPAAEGVKVPAPLKFRRQTP